MVFDYLGVSCTTVSHGRYNVGTCSTRNFVQLFMSYVLFGFENARGDRHLGTVATPHTTSPIQRLSDPLVGPFDQFAVLARFPYSNSIDGRIVHYYRHTTSSLASLPTQLSQNELEAVSAVLNCPNPHLPAGQPTIGKCFVSWPEPQSAGLMHVYVPNSFTVDVTNVYPTMLRSTPTWTCPVPPHAVTSEPIERANTRTCRITYSGLVDGTTVDDILSTMAIGNTDSGIGPCTAARATNTYGFSVRPSGLCPHALSQVTRTLLPCAGAEAGTCARTDWKSDELPAGTPEPWRYYEGRWPFPCRCNPSRILPDCSAARVCTPIAPSFDDVPAAVSTDWGGAVVVKALAAPYTGGLGWTATPRVVRIDCPYGGCAHPLWSAPASVDGHHPMRAAWSFKLSETTYAACAPAGGGPCRRFEVTFLGGAGGSVDKPVAITIGVYLTAPVAGGTTTAPAAAQYRLVANDVDVTAASSIIGSITHTRWHRLTVDFNWVTRSIAIHIGDAAVTPSEMVRSHRLAFYDRPMDDYALIPETIVPRSGYADGRVASVGDVGLWARDVRERSTIQGLVGAVAQTASPRGGVDIAAFEIICAPPVWPTPVDPLGRNQTAPGLVVPVISTIPFVAAPQTAAVPSTVGNVGEGLFYTIGQDPVVVSGQVFVLTLVSTTPIATGAGAIRLRPVDRKCDEPLNESSESTPFVVSTGASNAESMYWSNVFGFEQGMWGPATRIRRGSVALSGDVTEFVTMNVPINGPTMTPAGAVVSSRAANVRVTLPISAFANAVGTKLGVCYRASATSPWIDVQPLDKAAGPAVVYPVSWRPHLAGGTVTNLAEALGSWRAAGTATGAGAGGAPAGAALATKGVFAPTVLDRDRILLQLFGLPSSIAAALIDASVAASDPLAAPSLPQPVPSPAYRPLDVSSPLYTQPASAVHPDGSAGPVPIAPAEIITFSRSPSCDPAERIESTVCRCAPTGSTGAQAACCAFLPTGSGVFATVPSLCPITTATVSPSAPQCEVAADVYLCIADTPIPILQDPYTFAGPLGAAGPSAVVSSPSSLIGTGAPSATVPIGTATTSWADFSGALRVRALTWDGTAGSSPFATVVAAASVAATSANPSGPNVVGIGSISGRIPSGVPLRANFDATSSGLVQYAAAWARYTVAARAAQLGSCAAAPSATVTTGAVRSSVALWEPTSPNGFSSTNSTGGRSVRVVPELVDALLVGSTTSMPPAAVATLCLSSHYVKLDAAGNIVTPPMVAAYSPALTSPALRLPAATATSPLVAHASGWSTAATGPLAPWWFPTRVPSGAALAFGVTAPLSASPVDGGVLVAGNTDRGSVGVGGLATGVAASVADGHGGVGVISLAAASVPVGVSAVPTVVTAVVAGAPCAAYEPPAGAEPTFVTVPPDATSRSTDVLVPLAVTAATAGVPVVGNACISSPYSGGEYVPATTTASALTVFPPPLWSTATSPTRIVRGSPFTITLTRPPTPGSDVFSPYTLSTSVGSPTPPVAVAWTPVAATFPAGTYDILLSPTADCRGDILSTWSGTLPATVSLTAPHGGRWYVCLSTNRRLTWQRLCMVGEPLPCTWGFPVRAHGVADNYTATSSFALTVPYSPPRRRGLHPIFASEEANITISGHGLQMSDSAFLIGPLASCPDALRGGAYEPEDRDCVVVAGATAWPLRWAFGSDTTATFVVPRLSTNGTYALCYTPSASFASAPGSPAAPAGPATAVGPAPIGTSAPMTMYVRSLSAATVGSGLGEEACEAVMPSGVLVAAVPTSAAVGLTVPGVVPPYVPARAYGPAAGLPVPLHPSVLIAPIVPYYVPITGEGTQGIIGDASVSQVVGIAVGAALILLCGVAALVACAARRRRAPYEVFEYDARALGLDDTGAQLAARVEPPPKAPAALPPPPPPPMLPLPSIDARSAASAAAAAAAASAAAAAMNSIKAASTDALAREALIPLYGDWVSPPHPLDPFGAVYVPQTPPPLGWVGAHGGAPLVGSGLLGVPRPTMGMASMVSLGSPPPPAAPHPLMAGGAPPASALASPYASSYAGGGGGGGGRGTHGGGSGGRGGGGADGQSPWQLDGPDGRDTALSAVPADRPPPLLRGASSSAALAIHRSPGVDPISPFYNRFPRLAVDSRAPPGAGAVLGVGHSGVELGGSGAYGVGASVPVAAGARLPPPAGYGLGPLAHADGGYERGGGDGGTYGGGGYDGGGYGSGGGGGTYSGGGGGYNGGGYGGGGGGGLDGMDVGTSLHSKVSAIVGPPRTGRGPAPGRWGAGDY